MKTSLTFFERYSLPLFLILTLLISFAIPLFLSLPVEVTPLMLVLIPALLSITFAAAAGGKKETGALLSRLVHWRVGFKWYVLAFGLAIGIRLTISALALLFGWIPAIQLSQWSPPEFILIGVFIVIGAVAEELGWRGYVLTKLLAYSPGLYSALFLGIIWGTVHLGLILPGQMNAGAHWLPSILNIIGLSVILTWLYIQTQGSLIIPILFHAGQSFFVFLNGGITLTQQLWLLTVLYLAIAFGLILLTSVSLQREPGKKVVIVEPG
jgi:membrane protease YdiL (CAAX protease family)